MIYHQNSHEPSMKDCIKRCFSMFGRVLLSLFLILLVNSNAFADNSAKQDPALREYFNKCMLRLDSPDVLKMADTLENRARQAQNTYFQALARNTVLDYYYFKRDKEKILQLVSEIKRFCREYDEKDVYYFVWGSRLITYYLKNGQHNHALVEAQNMLREAQADDFTPGIAECYKAMANIYLMQSNLEQAVYNFQRLVDIVEQSKPDDVNLPVFYYSLIDKLIQLNRMDEADETLRKAQLLLDKKADVTAYQRLCLAQGYLSFYIKKKDAARSKHAFGEIENLFSTSKELAIYSVYLREASIRYYMSIKDYPKALAILDSVGRYNPTSEVNLIVLNRKGEIYWNMDDKASAAGYFRDYIFANDSIRKRSMQSSADEIAGLLDLRQLEQEKQQLMIDIQNRRLITTYWAIGTLAFILILATIVIVHIYRLNCQLKESKQVVVRQNNALLQSSEELRKAKDRAEEASRMKTDFIQNITHEVRTPLNTIVGFSQVLAEVYDEPETEEFASLITLNSNYLLRLFDDVLELSNADQVDYLPYDVLGDINSSCEAAINAAKTFVMDGVELIFQPAEENMRIYTNPSCVTLILNNLLHNAAKFTLAGSIVLEYAVCPADGVIRYSIADTGIGIPIDQCEAVFDRFKKLDTFAQGSGLGLAVSRTIAAKLGGTLYVDSKYTVGARLVLTLPFTPQ